MPRAPPLGELAGASPTERVSRLSQSRCAAISWLFGRAILSLRLRFSVSVLALSVTFGDSSPRGRAFGVPVRFMLDAESPTGRKRAGLATEGRPVFVQPLRRCAPAPLVGEPLAKRRSFPLCQSLPYKGRWHGVSRDGEVVRRERLWQAGRRKGPPFGDCCSERGGLSDKVPK